MALGFVSGRGRFSFGMVFVTLLLALSPFASAQITFRDITAQAGIHFTHNNAAFGKKYLPETLGAGGLFLDADGDGLPNGREQDQGLNSFNPPDASADNVGEGLSNAQEFLAGTDPNNVCG